MNPYISAPKNLLYFSLLNSPIKNCRKQNKCNIEIRKIQYEIV